MNGGCHVVCHSHWYTPVRCVRLVFVFVIVSVLVPMAIGTSGTQPAFIKFVIPSRPVRWASIVLCSSILNAMIIQLAQRTERLCFGYGLYELYRRDVDRERDNIHRRDAHATVLG